MNAAVIESKYSRFVYTDFEPTEDEIDRLYRELEEMDLLRSSRADDPEVDARRREMLDRLRELQSAEAERIREQVARNLKTPVGSGRRLREVAEGFLASHADPTTGNSTGPGANSPSA